MSPLGDGMPQCPLKGVCIISVRPRRQQAVAAMKLTSMEKGVFGIGSFENPELKFVIKSRNSILCMMNGDEQEPKACYIVEKDAGDEQKHDSVAPCAPEEVIKKVWDTRNVLRMSKYTLNLLPHPFATKNLNHGSDPSCDH